MAKRRPPLVDQVTYHLSEERGVWEVPLTVFAKSASGTTAAARSSRAVPTPTSLPVPSLVEDVSQAQRLVDRSYAELVATRRGAATPRNLATLVIAIAASVLAAVVSRQSISGVDTGLVSGIASVLVYVVVGLIVGAAVLWIALFAHRLTGSDEVAVAVWTERHRRYRVRLEELNALNSASVERATSLSTPRRWLPWR